MTLWHREFGLPVEVTGTMETHNGVSLVVRSLDPRQPGEFEADRSELTECRSWSGDAWRDN
jgi:hypothetical protein